ncbi:hypothetical protein GGQ61_000956 [Phenylobacterium haematophilum]|uniref:Uncharacterized protein n=1 Tax=Phenylobacterium haematophilum TaxID=98513 RepID=A0A839ZWY2_9CAUL|nr:hypothetical protein [Phenylobacterium haematophilum]MBB3890259.1 hypothetical protein [Phenylobacterium haematophilum]
MIEMRRGLVMGMVLGLLVGAAPAMADTLDDAAKRGSLKICVAEGAPYALMTPSEPPISGSPRNSCPAPWPT